MLRDVAYEGLAYRRRHELHLRAAAAIGHAAQPHPKIVTDALALHSRFATITLRPGSTLASPETAPWTRMPTSRLPLTTSRRWQQPAHGRTRRDRTSRGIGGPRERRTNAGSSRRPRRRIDQRFDSSWRRPADWLAVGTKGIDLTASRRSVPRHSPGATGVQLLDADHAIEARRCQGRLFAGGAKIRQRQGASKEAMDLARVVVAGHGLRRSNDASTQLPHLGTRARSSSAGLTRRYSRRRHRDLRCARRAAGATRGAEQPRRHDILPPGTQNHHESTLSTGSRECPPMRRVRRRWHIRSEHRRGVHKPRTAQQGRTSAPLLVAVLPGGGLGEPPGIRDRRAGPGSRRRGATTPRTISLLEAAPAPPRWRGEAVHAAASLAPPYVVYADTDGVDEAEETHAGHRPPHRAISPRADRRDVRPRRPRLSCTEG